VYTPKDDASDPKKRRRGSTQTSMGENLRRRSHWVMLSLRVYATFMSGALTKDPVLSNAGRLQAETIVGMATCHR